MRELADLASPPELGAKLKLYCDPLWSGRPAFVAEMLSYAASGVPPPHAWCADALCIFLRVVAKLSDRVVGMVKDAKLSGADFLRLSRRAITNLTTKQDELEIMRAFVLALRHFFGYDNSSLELHDLQVRAPSCVKKRRVLPRFMCENVVKTNGKNSVCSFLPGNKNPFFPPKQTISSVTTTVTAGLDYSLFDTSWRLMERANKFAVY